METLLNTVIRLSRRWVRSTDSPISGRFADSVPELTPGATWGQFTIISKLGKGTFGQVYLAKDMFERNVALKLLDSPGAILEGKILSQVKHPNIVSVFSYEQSSSGVALSMEYIEGQSLEQYLQANGRLDPIHAAVIGANICRALAMVHRKGLLHRDIKAANVMRQADGRIVLVDFGLGQSISQDNYPSEIAGTLLYMAPELFVSGPASVVTDLYAVGVLLFYLVSGQYPVTGDCYSSLRENHRDGRRQHLLDVRPDLPTEFIEIVETAAHANPNRRFRSAGTMVAALENALRLRTTWRRRWLIIGLGIMVVGATVLSLARLWPNSEIIPDDVQFTRVTKADALSQDPTLSADGKLLAYASDEAQPGNMDIWIRQAPDGASMRLTNDSGIDWTPAFSPDGHLIAFRSEREGGGIYVISAFGGKEQLIAPHGFSPRFSPDGRYIAYYLGEPWHPRTPGARLYVIPKEGGTPRQICPEFADARNPVWAPDSQHILFQGSRDSEAPPDTNAEWWIASLDGSPPVNTHALGALHAQGLEVHAWAAFWKGEHVTFSAARQDNVNLWRTRIHTQSGFRMDEAQRITSGTGFETSPWIADNGTIAFVNQGGLLRIWSFPISQSSLRVGYLPDRVTNNADLDAFPSVSRDGKFLAFTRTPSETGIRQLWLKNVQTHEEFKLTDSNEAKENPLISPDGHQIVYSVFRGTGTDIIALDLNNRHTRQLCEGCGVTTGWAPDGKSVLISVSRSIEVLDVESGTRKRLLTRPGYRLDEAEVSPNGHWISFTAQSDQGERQIYVVNTKTPSEWQRVTTSSKVNDKPHWSFDGKALYFYAVDDGFQCIWTRDFDNKTGSFVGPQRPLQHFHNVRLSPIHISQPLRDFAVTSHRIYCNLAEVSGSVWMSVNRN